MSTPGPEGESPISGDRVREAELAERQVVRREIGARMYELTQGDMLGRDLELSAMVRWLAEYKGENAKAREALTGHACRMIAFRLGHGTTREAMADIEQVVGGKEVNRIMGELSKLAAFDRYYDCPDEVIAYWSPVIDDVHFVAGCVMHPEWLEL